MDMTTRLVVEGTEEQFDNLMEAMNIDEADVEASEWYSESKIQYTVLIRHQIEAMDMLKDVQKYIAVVEIIK